MLMNIVRPSGVAVTPVISQPTGPVRKRRISPLMSRQQRCCSPARSPCPSCWCFHVGLHPHHAATVVDPQAIPHGQPKASPRTLPAAGARALAASPAEARRSRCRRSHVFLPADDVCPCVLLPRGFGSAAGWRA
jgi:hypothetical protein